MLHYEREYVEHLQKQIGKYAETIDAQNIVIKSLLKKRYE